MQRPAPRQLKTLLVHHAFIPSPAEAGDTVQGGEGRDQGRVAVSCQRIMHLACPPAETGGTA
jgi:hypothetical protein